MLRGRRHKHPRAHTRKVLRAKRGHLLSKVDAVTAPAQSGAAIDVRALQSLRASLQTLRHDIRHDAGPGPRAAAQALQELDTSLAKLVQAQTGAPGANTQALLEDGLRALNRAGEHARKAGRDWPL